MNLKFKIAANTLVQVVGKIITAGVTFIITILIARNYGVFGFGEFTKIITYVSLFYLIVDFGMNAIFLKEDSEDKKNEWTDLLILRIVWALILIFIALSILVFLPYNPLTLQGFTPLSKLGIIVLIPTILTQAIFVSTNALFQKNLRYDKSIISVSLSSLIILIFVFLFIKIKAPLIFILGAYVFGGIIMALLSLFFVKNFTSFRKDLFDTSKIDKGKILFLKSLPLGLILIFNLIYFKIDVLILTVFRSTKEVGIYGLAFKFFEFPLSVPTFFMNAVYPVLLKVKTRYGNLPAVRQDMNYRSEWNKIIRRSAIFLLLSSLVLTIAGLFLAPLAALIKQEFSASVLPFRILIFSLPFFFLSSLFMWVLIANGKTKDLVKIYGLGMFINIFLNLIFIPRFGYNAAAIITGLSEFLIFAILLKYLKENMRVDGFDDDMVEVASLSVQGKQAVKHAVA